MGARFGGWLPDRLRESRLVKVGTKEEPSIPAMRGANRLSGKDSIPGVVSAGAEVSDNLVPAAGSDDWAILEKDPLGPPSVNCAEASKIGWARRGSG